MSNSLYFGRRSDCSGTKDTIILHDSRNKIAGWYEVVNYHDYFIWVSEENELETFAVGHLKEFSDRISL